MNVDDAGLLVAIIALILSACAVFIGYRQARAAERATDAAEQSAKAAAETLATAQKMEKYDAIRLHAERRPEITLNHRKLKETANGHVRGIRLTNEGPIPYDEWRISVDREDPETVRLLTGILDDDGDARPYVTVTDVDDGQSIDLEVERVIPLTTGAAKFVIWVRRDQEEWRIVLRLRFARPQRVIVG